MKRGSALSEVKTRRGIRKSAMFSVDYDPTEDVSDTEINNYLLRELKHTRIKSRLPVSNEVSSIR